MRAGESSSAWSSHLGFHETKPLSRATWTCVRPCAPFAAASGSSFWALTRSSITLSTLRLWRVGRRRLMATSATTRSGTNERHVPVKGGGWPRVGSLTQRSGGYGATQDVPGRPSVCRARPRREARATTERVHQRAGKRERENERSDSNDSHALTRRSVCALRRERTASPMRAKAIWSTFGA